jgi:hypothetical protein
MPNPRLRHDRNRHSSHDLLDELGVAHAGHAALGADVGRHALEGHDGDGAGLFGDACLRCVSITQETRDSRLWVTGE